MACKTGKALKDNQILIIYFIGEEIRVQRRICILFFFFFGCAGSSLWHVDFSRGAHRLGWATASGILDPQPGIKPTSPALEGRFFPGPPGKSQEFVLFLQSHFLLQNICSIHVKSLVFIFICLTLSLCICYFQC